MKNYKLRFLAILIFFTISNISYSFNGEDVVNFIKIVIPGTLCFVLLPLYIHQCYLDNYFKTHPEEHLLHLYKLSYSFQYKHPKPKAQLEKRIAKVEEEIRKMREENNSTSTIKWEYLKPKDENKSESKNIFFLAKNRENSVEGKVLNIFPLRTYKPLMKNFLSQKKDLSLTNRIQKKISEYMKEPHSSTDYFSNNPFFSSYI